MGGKKNKFTCPEGLEGIKDVPFKCEPLSIEETKERVLQFLKPTFKYFKTPKASRKMISDVVKNAEGISVYEHLPEHGWEEVEITCQYTHPGIYAEERKFILKKRSTH